MRLLIIVLSMTFSANAFSKQVKYRKTQEVDFDGVSVEGEVRAPAASYLTQRRGMKFMPMYKVRKKFDEQIKESVDFLR